MSKVMEDMVNEAAREAAKEAERRLITEIAHRMLSMGLSHEQVAEVVGITVEQVQDIAGMKGEWMP